MREIVRLADKIFRARLVDRSGYTSDYKLNKPPFADRYGFYDNDKRSAVAHAAIFFCEPQEGTKTALALKMPTQVYVSGE